MAPRRSSSNDFARASFAHSSTQVRNVTAHSVDGCETRRTQSPFDEIYMAHDASGLRFPGSPPPPAAPGRTGSEWPRAFGKLRGACKLKSEREAGGGREKEASPGSRSPRRGGLNVSLKSRSSSATASKWKDCKPYTTSRPGRSERS